jgi:hypothetical protein
MAEESSHAAAVSLLLVDDVPLSDREALDVIVQVNIPFALCCSVQHSLIHRFHSKHFVVLLLLNSRDSLVFPLRF